MEKMHLFRQLSPFGGVAQTVDSNYIKSFLNIIGAAMHEANHLNMELVPLPLPLPLTPQSLLPVRSQFDFRTYPLQDFVAVGTGATYYVQEAEPGQILMKSEFFVIQLTRPDGSTEILRLNEDNNPYYLGRHFFSFLPLETGHHVISVLVKIQLNEGQSMLCHIQGSPIIVSPIRTYPSSDSCNNAFCMGVKPQVIPFCLRAWGVDVYRPNNWIYVVDRETHTVFVLDASLNLINRFGGRGLGPDSLLFPIGVAVDEINQRVVITDKDHHRIAVYDLEGHFLFCFGCKGQRFGQFRYPRGVAVSPDGRWIAVADPMNLRIQLFDSNGTFVKACCNFLTIRNGDYYATRWYYPNALAFSPDGSQIYVTDHRNNTLLVLNTKSEKNEFLVFSEHLRFPQGLAVDGAGNLIIADMRNNCIRIWSPDGTLNCRLNGSDGIKFDGPTDVAVLRGGSVVIVDSKNRLRLF